jgi:cytochrome c oxidase cbb3-type subunit 3
MSVIDPSSVPPSPQAAGRDQLSGHEYDGIQEYDNPTPGWWVAVFAATVVFSVFYFVYYHGGVPERSIYDRYAEAETDNAKKVLASLGITELTVTPENMAQWITRKEFVDYGRGVFKANCVSCHGMNGEGGVGSSAGPNMTDDYYKNIKTITDLPRVVAAGAANGAMPAWGPRLSKTDIALVAAYAASLRGQNLPGREPLGEKIAPWPAAPATAPAAGK